MNTAKKREYISRERAAQLEEIVGWLSAYDGPEDGVEHHVGDSVDQVDEEYTALLLELGRINKLRTEIIKKFQS